MPSGSVPPPARKLGVSTSASIVGPARAHLGLERQEQLEVLIGGSNGLSGLAHDFFDELTAREDYQGLDPAAQARVLDNYASRLSVEVSADLLPSQLPHFPYTLCLQRHQIERFSFDGAQGPADFSEIRIHGRVVRLITPSLDNPGWRERVEAFADVLSHLPKDSLSAARTFVLNPCDSPKQERIAREHGKESAHMTAAIHEEDLAVMDGPAQIWVYPGFWEDPLDVQVHCVAHECEHIHTLRALGTDRNSQGWQEYASDARADALTLTATGRLNPQEDAADVGSLLRLAGDSRLGYELRAMNPKRAARLDAIPVVGAE
jgi:hypothetical protein